MGSSRDPQGDPKGDPQGDSQVDPQGNPQEDPMIIIKGFEEDEDMKEDLKGVFKRTSLRPQGGSPVSF